MALIENVFVTACFSFCSYPQAVDNLKAGDIDMITVKFCKIILK